MSLTSGFFDAMEQGEGNYDRVYTAAEFAHYFSLLVGNGVFPSPDTGLNVLASDPASMTVKIGDGSGWINGYFVTVSGGHSVTLEAASGAGTRIDSIIMQWNSNDRKINIISKSGTASGDPKPVDLQRDAELWELELAQITVGAGVSSIDQTKIKDMRADSNRCGLVTALLKGIDPSTFLKQSEAEFNQWFSTIMNKISSEDVAGSLLKMITEVDNREKEHYESTKVTIQNVEKGILKIDGESSKLTKIGDTIRLFGNNRLYGEERQNFPSDKPENRTANTYLLGDKKHFLKITSNASTRFILYSIQDLLHPVFTMELSDSVSAPIWSDETRFIVTVSAYTATFYVFKYDNTHIEQVHKGTSLNSGSKRYDMGFMYNYAMSQALLYDYSYNDKLFLAEAYYGSSSTTVYPTVLDLNTYDYKQVNPSSGTISWWNEYHYPYKDGFLLIPKNLLNSSGSSVTQIGVTVKEYKFSGELINHEFTLDLLSAVTSCSVESWCVLGDKMIISLDNNCGMFMCDLITNTVVKKVTNTSVFRYYVSYNDSQPSMSSTSSPYFFVVYDKLYTVDMTPYDMNTLVPIEQNLTVNASVDIQQLVIQKPTLTNLFNIPNSDVYCQLLSADLRSVCNAVKVEKSVKLIGG